jgi:hypothetical protein
MNNAIRFRAATAVLLAAVLHGCSPATVRDPVSTAGSGGSSAGSGGAGNPRGATGGDGGSGGTAGAGGSGGAIGTGGTGGTGGARPADAARPFDAPRPPAPSPDAPPPPPPPPPPPDAGAQPDAPVAPDAPPGSDAGTLVPGVGGGIASCFSNPLVVTICRQLEPACQNCPPGGAPPANQTAAACFALIARAKAGNATDAECVKFFEDNNCTVDNGGNVCGSINCNATGCNKAMCEAAYENGDSTACMGFLAPCPCR